MNKHIKFGTYIANLVIKSADLPAHAQTTPPPTPPPTPTPTATSTIGATGATGHNIAMSMPRPAPRLNLGNRTPYSVQP